MLLKGDKVLHNRHPEWGVGIVQGIRYPGYMVFFQEDPYIERKREWICSAGHLHKVNGYSAEEVKKQQAEFEEEIRLRQILEARRMLEIPDGNSISCSATMMEGDQDGLVD